jgi:hypothetical protein
VARDTWTVDPWAPITPGVGLGGLQLGLHVMHYHWLVGFDARVQESSALFTFEAMYGVFGPGAEAPVVAISVDVRDGVVFKLTALHGYQGSYESLTVGMAADDLRRDERFAWNDLQDCVDVKGVEGLAILPHLPDDRDITETEIPARPVKEIAVFLPERGLSPTINYWPPDQHWA